MRLPHPILIVCVAVFCGCSVDALMKGITLGGTPVITATAWRYIAASAIMVALFLLTKKKMPGWSAIRFHILRSVAQVSSAVTFFYALTQIALAEAVVLGFTAALMIAPIARIVLGEKMSHMTIGASLVGFCGAALAASGQTTGVAPDGNRVLGIAAMLFSAVGYALNIVLLRLRTRDEDSLTLVTFMNVLPALFLLPFLLATEPLPQANAWPLIGLVSIAAIGIWWLMTLAYARAQAQTLAPFDYTGLIWASLFGYVFFHEVPSLRLYAGAAIIIVACLAVAFDTHFAARREARATAAEITP
ncbi:MAG: DMT family transporter [Hyphomonas sp.]|uniref:DMT family transporter n=1 Tax=Hyphomonas sp. TaxID=87 RepID=UPI003527D728